MEELAIKGAFVDSLKRNNKQIRDDRAASIAEDAEMTYKRTVEDLEISYKKLTRDRDNLLDMSPTNATSLIVASDFDATSFVKKDMEIGLRLREIEITLEIARKRYTDLFTSKTE